MGPKDQFPSVIAQDTREARIQITISLANIDDALDGVVPVHMGKVAHQGPGPRPRYF